MPPHAQSAAGLCRHELLTGSRGGGAIGRHPGTLGGCPASPHPCRASPGALRARAASPGRTARNDLSARAVEHLRQSTAGSLFAGVDLGHHVRFGAPAAELLAGCRELGGGLLVVGARKRSGLTDLLLGSTAERVLRKAEVPVLVSRRALPAADLHPRADRLLHGVARGARRGDRAGAPLGRAVGAAARDRADRAVLRVGDRPRRRRVYVIEPRRAAARVGRPDRHARPRGRALGAADDQRRGVDHRRRSRRVAQRRSHRHGHARPRPG